MRYNPNQAEQIWKIIEEGLEEFKKKSSPPAAQQPIPAPETSTATANGSGNDNDNGNDSAFADENAPADSKESESDSERATNGNQNVLSMVTIIGHAVAQSDITKSTKKALKKLQKRNDIPLNVQSPKKKKFIKFLLEHLNFDTETSNTVWECVLESIHALSSEVNGISNGMANGKKRKNTDNAGPDSKKPKTEIIVADSTTDANGESTFDWQKHILRIFNKSQTNNQLPIDALKLRVIKKFLKSVGEDESNSVKYEKKFKKNLKKINQLATAGGFVQLKA